MQGPSASAFRVLELQAGAGLGVSFRSHFLSVHTLSGPGVAASVGECLLVEISLCGRNGSFLKRVEAVGLWLCSPTSHSVLRSALADCKTFLAQNSLAQEVWNLGRCQVQVPHVGLGHVPFLYFFIYLSLFLISVSLV